MKTLPVSFTKGNMPKSPTVFEFKQLRREDDVALYQKTIQGTDVRSFEVIRVRKYPTYEIADAVIEAHEQFPPNEAWGDEAWTRQDEAAATELFKQKHTENPHTQIIGVATGVTRGRKRDEFEIEIPTGEFTVKQLHEKYPTKSVPFIHLRLNELKEQGRVKLVRTQKIAGQKGKPTNIYEAVPLDELPKELAEAQTESGAL